MASVSSTQNLQPFQVGDWIKVVILDYVDILFVSREYQTREHDVLFDIISVISQDIFKYDPQRNCITLPPQETIKVSPTNIEVLKKNVVLDNYSVEKVNSIYEQSRKNLEARGLAPTAAELSELQRHGIALPGSHTYVTTTTFDKTQECVIQ